MSSSHPATSAAKADATRLSQTTPYKWTTGIAAWLGWLFDGLELHIYTLIAGPRMLMLMAVSAATR